MARFAEQEELILERGKEREGGFIYICVRDCDEGKIQKEKANQSWILGETLF